MGVYLINCQKNLEIKIGTSSKVEGRKCFLASKDELIELKSMGYLPIHIEENGFNFLDDWINSNDVIYEREKTIKEIEDEAIKELWIGLEDITFVEDDDARLVLSSNWHIWNKGTHISDIWLWFHEHYSKGVLYLATIC